MWRNISRWGVSLAGLVLVVAGAAAMSSGWETIQVERGWSLFISGAIAFSGGLIVAALGQILARLDEFIIASKGREAQETAAPIKPAKVENAPPRERAAQASAAPPPAPKWQEQVRSEPAEVDRYESGDITYVMYSDGAVEVRTPNGAQRYASLAELRAEAAPRR
ncbi:hypothetical protein [Methylocystis heyeri]|uniref:DUF308 domain-containing protein n=1 Tax=Methylocystis heyeri TaxID=391905 RepID=A0A6B8KAI1_9HYPH|nr:hypothetical protein [Methylocystis heyeri]QGM45314.1 hypothetical protein H2LOC_006170 [Methylocystis heyeri]